uniref:Uncharacterized protein n=1 Tax=Ciona savignyi TaxID=51511 RepID=H2ZDZ5_CIOSA
MEEEKSLYQIKSEARVEKLKTLQRNEAKLVPKRFQLITKQSALPVFLGVAVWSVAGYAAYKAWVRDENEPIPLELPQEEVKPVKKPRRIPIWKPLTMEELGYKHFNDGNSYAEIRALSKNQNLVVSVNEEYERIEVLNLTKPGWYIWVYNFDVLARDANGNFMYDDDGYPICKPTPFEKIKQFLSNKLFSK